MGTRYIAVDISRYQYISVVFVKDVFVIDSFVRRFRCRCVVSVPVNVIETFVEAHRKHKNASMKITY